MEIIRKELVLLVKRNQDIPQSLELSEFKSWERRSERELHEMIEPALARLRQDIANIRETFTAKDGRPDENSVPKEVIEIVEPLLATLRNEVKDVFEIIRQELSVLEGSLGTFGSSMSLATWRVVLIIILCNRFL